MKAKKLYLLIVSILLSQIIFCQNPASNRTYTQGKSCKIKSKKFYKNFYTRLDRGRLTPKFQKNKMYLRQKYNYDIDGKFISDSLFTKKGNLEFTSKYTYDEKKRIIGIYRKIGLNSYYDKLQYLGDKIIIHKIKQGNIFATDILIKDQDGRTTERLFLNDKRDTLKNITYKYDDHGNESKFAVTFPDRTENYSFERKYDGDQLLTFEHFDYENKLVSKKAYKETANKSYKKTSLRLIKQEVYHEEVTVDKIEKFKSKTIYFEDACGNAIKKYSNLNRGFKGNWITTYIDIEYYDDPKSDL